VMGAHLNVKINAKSLSDKSVANSYLGRGAQIEKIAIELELTTLSTVNRKIQP
jgi:hypothetical protein